MCFLHEIVLNTCKRVNITKDGRNGTCSGGGGEKREKIVQNGRARPVLLCMTRGQNDKIHHVAKDECGVQGGIMGGTMGK